MVSDLHWDHQKGLFRGLKSEYCFPLLSKLKGKIYKLSMLCLVLTQKRKTNICYVSKNAFGHAPFTSLLITHKNTMACILKTGKFDKEIKEYVSLKYQTKFNLLN